MNVIEPGFDAETFDPMAEFGPAYFSEATDILEVLF